MKEINIIIKDVPTRFIRTKNHGDLNYERTKYVIEDFLFDYNEEWCDYDHDITILNWLEDNGMIYHKRGRKDKIESMWEVIYNNQKRNDDIPLRIFYNKITERERIMDKLTES